MTYTAWTKHEGNYCAMVEQDKYSNLWRGIVLDCEHNYETYRYEYYATKRSAIVAMRKQLNKVAM